jgi:hypothetical protein
LLKASCYQNSVRVKYNENVSSGMLGGDR